MEELSVKEKVIRYLSEDDEYTIHYLPSKIEYKKNGLLHREDGPAVIYNNGSKEWYIDGNHHRDNDLPAIEYADGDKEWYKDGSIHRDNDLPAVDNINGYKAWWKDGKRHRLTGPARIFVNGSGEYWVEGEEYSKEEFDEKVKELICT